MVRLSGYVSDELIEVMASQPKIVHYLDMPLQHGDARTLRRMKRPSKLEMVHDHMSKLRKAMPDITLRTTFIVGFPGETEEEFQGLLDFVRKIEFDKVGAFKFSPEPGTSAYDLPDPISDEVQEERYARLMETQQPISPQESGTGGKMLDVLVEAEGEIEGSGDPLLLARSYRDAPEVDGLVLIPGIMGMPIGEMMQVHINGAMEYDLVGEPLVAETFRSQRQTVELT